MICSTFRKIFKSCVYASFQPFKVSNIGTHSPIIYWMAYICHQNRIPNRLQSIFVECLTKHIFAQFQRFTIKFVSILQIDNPKSLKFKQRKRKVNTGASVCVIKERFSCKQQFRVNLKHIHTRSHSHANVKSTCDLWRVSSSLNKQTI